MKENLLNRTLNAMWTHSYVFTPGETGLPVCLICGEKLAKKQKSQMLLDIFQNKHTAFTEKYPGGDERKKSHLRGRGLN